MNLTPLMQTGSFEVKVLHMHICSANKRAMEWLLNVTHGDMTHIMENNDVEVVDGRHIPMLVVNGWLALAMGELDAYFERVRELIE